MLASRKPTKRPSISSAARKSPSSLKGSSSRTNHEPGREGFSCLVLPSRVRILGWWHVKLLTVQRGWALPLGWEPRSAGRGPHRPLPFFLGDVSFGWWPGRRRRSDAFDMGRAKTGYRGSDGLRGQAARGG